MIEALLVGRARAEQSQAQQELQGNGNGMSAEQHQLSPRQQFS